MLEIAKQTFEKNEHLARECVVLALTEDDAIDALDRLLPQASDPAWENVDDMAEELDMELEVQSSLSPKTKQKIKDLALGLKNKTLANKILAKLD